MLAWKRFISRNGFTEAWHSLLHYCRCATLLTWTKVGILVTNSSAPWKSQGEFLLTKVWNRSELKYCILQKQKRKKIFLSLWDMTLSQWLTISQIWTIFVGVKGRKFTKRCHVITLGELISESDLKHLMSYCLCHTPIFASHFSWYIQ